MPVYVFDTQPGFGFTHLVPWWYPLGMRASQQWRTAVLIAMCSGAACLPGCSSMGGGGSPRASSTSPEGGSLSLDLPTRCFTARDGNWADFYLTDLPAEVFHQGADATSARGTILHVHMFLNPKAGRTPLSTSASTCIVRVLVIADGQIGVYGGGGFMSRGGGVDEPNLTARLRAGTLELTRATPGFADALGQSVVSGTFSCPRDDREALLISRAMTALAWHAAEVTPQPLVDVAPPPAAP